MVHCGTFEGRHTATLVAAQLDQVVDDLNCKWIKSPDMMKFCTSDNAANMLSAIPAKTKSFQYGFGCFDHKLQLVVNKALDSNDEIVASIDAFKKLVARTHKSSLDQERIRRECEKITQDASNNVSVKYVKIITPVETRWNSTFMMIKSILALQPALEDIKCDSSRNIETRLHNTDPKLQAAIPDHEHFELLKTLVRPLEEVAKISADMSGETSPTSCFVVPRLYNLNLILGSMATVTKKRALPESTRCKININFNNLCTIHYTRFD